MPAILINNYTKNDRLQYLTQTFNAKHRLNEHRRICRSFERWLWSCRRSIWVEAM